jgi:hypothetical protein
MPRPFFSPIHRSAWNENSRKFISRILHSLTPLPLKTPAPGTLQSPAPIPLVTPMDRYARSWMSFLQTSHAPMGIFVSYVQFTVVYIRRPCGIGVGKAKVRALRRMGEEAAGPIDGDAGGLFSHGDYTAANCSSFASGGCGSYPSGGVPLARLDQAHVPQLVPVFRRRGAAARPLARTPRAGPLGGVSAHSPAYAFFVRHACSPLYTSRSTS